MDVIRDPDGLELTYLREHTDFAGARVLEVGCGEGRLTWQYGDLARDVIGIDPDLPSLRSAVAETPESLQTNLSFLPSQAESLPFPNNAFDIAILAWSL